MMSVEGELPGIDVSGCDLKSILSPALEAVAVNNMLSKLVLAGAKLKDDGLCQVVQALIRLVDWFWFWFFFCLFLCVFLSLDMSDGR